MNGTRLGALKGAYIKSGCDQPIQCRLSHHRQRKLETYGWFYLSGRCQSHYYPLSFILCGIVSFYARLVSQRCLEHIWSCVDDKTAIISLGSGPIGLAVSQRHAAAAFAGCCIFLFSLAPYKHVKSAMVMVYRSSGGGEPMLVY